MKAIARYSFQGNAAHSQLSFPVGAQLTIKSKSNQDGWVYGTYGVQNGWLPASYVEIFPEATALPHPKAVNNTSMYAGIYSPQQRQQRQQQPSLYQQRPNNSKMESPVSPRLRSRVLDVPPGMSASVGFVDRSVTSSTPTTTTTTTTNNNNIISHDDVLPPINSVSFDNNQCEDTAVSVIGDNESVNVFRDNNIQEQHVVPFSSPPDDENEPFPLMGGVPGSLFDAAPNKVALVEETILEQEQQLPDEKLEAPVDIYRHASPKKKLWNHRSEYSPEISVQVTSKPRPTTPTTMTYKTKVAPVHHHPVTPEEFWKAHPGRTGTITPSEQHAYEVDHVFAGMKDDDKIEIVVEKKKKFHIMPKGLKSTWKKAKEGVLAIH